MTWTQRLRNWISKGALFLAVPGAAYLATSRPRLSYLVPLSGLILVSVFTVTRWIIDPILFLLMNLGLVALHLGSLAHASRAANRNLVDARIGLLALTFLVCMHIAIVVIGHTNKAALFGFQLYHIPSPSMQPTLLPGDIILVDTWVKQNQLEDEQIVVFKRHSKGVVLVKRVASLRGQSEAREMYLLGDNPSRSMDSRRFGWVSSEYLIGRVTAVLFTIKRENYSINDYPSEALQ